MEEETINKIIKLKGLLDAYGIDYSHLVYMPMIPVLSIEKSFVIEEVAGIKVASLISPSED